MKSMLKNILYILSIPIIVIIIFFISILLNFNRVDYNIDNTWVDCIGTMTYIGNDRSGETEFLYSYNNVLYEKGSYIRIHSQILNDKYILKVNPQKPNRYIPLEWKPVFTKDEKTNFTFGKVIAISKKRFNIQGIGINRDSLSKYDIIFSYNISDVYEVSDGNMEKKQGLPPTYKSLYPNLKVGQEYVVEYLDEIPERAIIYLDKPAQR